MHFQMLVAPFALLLSFGLASARPISTTTVAAINGSDNNNNATIRPFGMTAAQILQAVPSTASCASEVKACRTATQIAPLVNKSFAKFGFITPGEQAALFSLMAFESGNFAFDVNAFPGRPGQGTRNMMMFDFILPYALQFNRTAVLAIRPDLTSQSTAADVPNDDEKNAIRATVLSDDLSFASAAWFLRTKCPSRIAIGLQSATADAFNAYMGPDCIGAGQDPARLTGYQTTLAAMGV